MKQCILVKLSKYTQLTFRYFTKFMEAQSFEIIKQSPTEVIFQMIKWHFDFQGRVNFHKYKEKYYVTRIIENSKCEEYHTLDAQYK